MSLRVLVVARAYPSFDAPGRGSFVHDHVVALQAAGADPIVASFETIQVRGDDDRRKARAARAEVAWSAALADPAACNAGPRLGAPGAPVARLPVIRTWGALDGSEVPEMSARHAAPLLAFGRALATRNAAAGRPIDVIHAHNGLPDGVAALSLAAELGVPLVVTEHDSTLRDRLRRPEAAAVYRELLRYARVVAVSQAQADRVTAALSDHGEPVPVPLAIVPNAVPLDHFPPAQQLRRDVDQLLWVGARSEHKGIDTLLRAMAVAHGRLPSLRLRLIGSATNAEDVRWQALADELGIRDAVSFEPVATRNVVGPEMQQVGIFVHPSPFETFGMVAAEALASGLPVAATPSGGVEEIVGRDGRFGEIATDATPEALADAILRLRDRLAVIDRDAMRDSIEERFSPAAVAARTLELYDEVRRAAVRSPATPRAGPSPGQGAPSSKLIGAALFVAAHGADRLSASHLTSGRLPVAVVAPDSTPRTTRSERWVRRLTGSRSADARTSFREAIRARWDELAAEHPDGRVVIVPADVGDLEAALEALGEKGPTNLAPGSRRWLADRQDASTEPVRR
ncbi:MAG: glycosyltransferase family 4 protein [Chloroflexota bacterium]